MRHIRLLIPLLLLSCLYACNNSDDEGTDAVVLPTASLKGYMENFTKASVSSDYQTTWNDGDELAVFDASSGFVKFTLESGAGEAIGHFKGDAAVTPSKVAVYPYQLSPSISGDNLTITLPSTYTYSKEENTRMPMLAFAKDGNDADKLVFRQLCGVLTFELYDIPEEATKILLSSEGQQLSGNYSLDISDRTVKPEVGAYETTSSTDSTITILLPSDRDTALTISVPVPTGTYGTIGIRVLNDADEDVGKAQRISENLVVMRRELIAMKRPYDAHKPPEIPALKVTFVQGGKISEVYRWEDVSDSIFTTTGSGSNISTTIQYTAIVEDSCTWSNKMELLVNDDMTGANFDAGPDDAITVTSSADGFTEEIHEITYTVTVDWSKFKGSYFYSYVFQLHSMGNFVVEGEDKAYVNIFNHNGVYAATTMQVLDYNSCDTRLPATNVIDGKTTGGWGTFWASGWKAGRDKIAKTLPHYIDIEMTEASSISGFKFYIGSGAYQKDTKGGYVAVSSDGQNWTTICDFDLSSRSRYVGGQLGPFYVTCKPTTVKYFRFAISESGRIRDDGTPATAITEIQPMKSL